MKAVGPNPIHKRKAATVATEASPPIEWVCVGCGVKLENPAQGMLCPNCHQETQNFEEADVVDEQDKNEDSIPDYQESVFEIKK